MMCRKSNLLSCKIFIMLSLRLCRLGRPFSYAPGGKQKWHDVWRSNILQQTCRAKVSAEHEFCQSDIPCAHFIREFATDMLDLWLEKAFNPSITKDWISDVAEWVLVPQLSHSCINKSFQNNIFLWPHSRMYLFGAPAFVADAFL